MNDQQKNINDPQKMQKRKFLSARMLYKIDRSFNKMRQTQTQNNRNNRFNMHIFFHRIILQKILTPIKNENYKFKE